MLFGRRKEEGPLAPHQEKTANKIAEKILAVQSSMAAKLNAQAQKMGKENTLVLLGAVLIGFACYMVYIMVNAII